MKALLLSTLIALGSFNAQAGFDLFKGKKEISIYEYYSHYGHGHHEMINGGLTGGNSDFGHQKDLRGFHKELLHRGKKEIVITIDDGPTPGVTDKILDVLKVHGIQATFFVLAHKLDENGNVGRSTVNKNKKTLERMVREGHIVANHSMEHSNIGEIGRWGRKKKIKRAIIDAHKIIEPYMVNSPKWYFRAPYGSWQKQAAEIVNKTEYASNYYGPLLWDIGGGFNVTDAGVVKEAADWGCWSKGWSVDKCLAGYTYETNQKEGGIVLFHDLRSQSVELISRYIETFKAKGYKFVSLDDVNID